MAPQRNGLTDMARRVHSLLGPTHRWSIKADAWHRCDQSHEAPAVVSSIRRVLKITGPLAARKKLMNTQCSTGRSLTRIDVLLCMLPVALFLSIVSFV
jgi:hypothetical protein